MCWIFEVWNHFKGSNAFMRQVLSGAQREEKVAAVQRVQTDIFVGSHHHFPVIEKGSNFEAKQGSLFTSLNFSCQVGTRRKKKICSVEFFQKTFISCKSLANKYFYVVITVA